MVNEHQIYKCLSENETERRKRYKEFVKGMLKEKNAMKGEMDKRVIYGSESFLDKTTRKYKIEAIIKPKGRPKKGEEEGK